MEQTQMRRAASLISFCLITVFASGLILFTKDVSAAASEAVVLCMNRVIPSLFPFFVLSSLAVAGGAALVPARLFSAPMRVLFRLPGACTPAYILGLIGGYPVGVKTAVDIYDCGGCTREECERLLSFCSSCGPAFIFSAVGSAMFGSLRVGAAMYVCHISAAAFIGMISAFFSPKARAEPPQKSCTAGRAMPFPSLFTSAVTSSFSSMLNVCAFVIFFASLGAFLKSSGALGLISGAIPFIPPELTEAALSGILEMTGGVAAVSALNLAPHAAMALCAFIMGWGGLSVHCQAMSVVGDRPISLKAYFRGKLMHGILSAAMTYAASKYFLRDIEVCASVYTNEQCIGSPLYFIAVMGSYLALALTLSAVAVKPEKKGS